MSVGPVQLIVLGFEHPDFRGEIVAELERLREKDGVRVIDTLALYKDADGEFEIAESGGHVVAALVGLGIEGEEVPHVAPYSDGSGVEEGWDVLDDIPRDTAAALLLIEHHWAVPLRDAVARAGGERLADGFISPLDLVEIGLVSAKVAETLRAIDTGAT
jgi:hypothetical protein